MISSEEKDNLLEVWVVMRRDGSSYLKSVYCSGIPPIAVPVMLRGLLSTALQKVPDHASDFDINEAIPNKDDAH
jgi:hypothetical protein